MDYSYYGFQWGECIALPAGKKHSPDVTQQSLSLIYP